MLPPLRHLVTSCCVSVAAVQSVVPHVGCSSHIVYMHQVVLIKKRANEAICCQRRQRVSVVAWRPQLRGRPLWNARVLYAATRAKL